MNAPRELRFAAAALFLGWFALWLGGFPKPNVDDGFFSGAAISLARDGRLANPWITGWLGYLENARTDAFLVQPPLYPFLQAAWLKLFGISTASFTAFACTLGFGASLACWQLLRLLGAPQLARLLAAAIITGWLLHRGLRPEALATVCGLGGQLCLLSRAKPFAWFAGGFLSSAAVLAHPIWLTLVIPATLLQLWTLRARLKTDFASSQSVRDDDPLFLRESHRRLFSFLIALLSGIALAFILLVLLLGRDFPNFLHDLRAHARFLAPAGGHLATFFAHLNVGYDRFVNLLVISLSCRAILSATHAPAFRRFTLFGLTAVTILGLLLYPAQSTMYLVLLCAVVPLLLARSTPKSKYALLVSPAVLLTAWLAIQHTLQTLADRQHDARALAPSVHAYLASTAPEQIVFDATTLRTVFDYRPPAGAVDLAWAWSPGLSARWNSPQALQPRDLWVINPVWSHRQLGDEAARARFHLYGRAFSSVRSSRALMLVAGSALETPAGLPFIRSAQP